MSGRSAASEASWIVEGEFEGNKRGIGRDVKSLAHEPTPCAAAQKKVASLLPAAAQGKTVFVRAQAPYRALTSNAVTTVVACAGRRAGLGLIGAHRLRHSAATAMLRAGGSLTEIGQTLRHVRPLTTAIYAKVNVEALRPLARPWPAEAVTA